MRVGRHDEAYMGARLGAHGAHWRRRSAFEHPWVQEIIKRCEAASDHVGMVVKTSPNRVPSWSGRVVSSPQSSCLASFRITTRKAARLRSVG